jgi:electron transfer flavoprotein alpha subunit
MSKDICVFLEQRGGKLQKVGLELLGEAKRLVQDGQQVVGILAGNNVSGIAQTAFQYGADKVVVIDNPALDIYVTEPYTKALTAATKQLEPEIVLFGATSIGRDLAPRVACRIHTGLTADCTSLDVDPESKLLLMTRPAFGGNIMATIICPDYRPQMATVRPGVMKMPEHDTAKSGEVTKLEVAFGPEDMNVEIVEVVPNEKKSVDVTMAEILVSGGRGVGGAAGYEPLHKLAAVLGGEVSASRMGVDSGWIEKERQVGQTGKTVRPKVYMALGISGSIQHMAGMEESEFILCVDKDETTPMMALADLGVEGDLKEIVPKLTEAIKKHKESKAM